MIRAFSATRKVFKKVTHVIFDLDGTLIDTEKVNKCAIDAIAKKYGKIYTPEICMKLVGTPERESSRIAITEMKLPLTVDQFIEEYREQSFHLLSSCPLTPGAEHLIKHLYRNKIPIAIATSASDEEVVLKTKTRQDIFSLFSHIITSSDQRVKRYKPNPDVFLVCASQFPENPKPDQCLAFEDSPNGVIAAIDAGMQCIMVPAPDMLSTLSRATLVIRTLEELKLEDFGLPPIVT